MIVAIWGMGYAGKQLLEKELKNVRIDFVIDHNEKATTKFEVVKPEKAVVKEYDLIIVTTGYAREVYKEANDLGFDMTKFVFIYNNYVFEDLNKNYELASKILAPGFIDIIKNRYRVIRGMVWDEMNKIPALEEEDYNRIKTFQLVADEIKIRNVRGQVAELGVFRGEFAKYINKAFPDKKCYLFDTFEGFRDEEAESEKKQGNCGDTFIEYFKSTTMQKVMEVMPFPEQVVCKPGLFPESLNGLEDSFSFVSIDVDFEQSIYDGLSYFYPRLCEGGYIFIHDYNSELKGVKNAVIKYERAIGKNLAKLPIPDVNGTLVLTK